MSNINFDLYNLFYIVANTGNISKAAEALYISQPAVTQSIHKLEEQLGGTLFYRVPKGVVLTEEGKKLYDYIKESIEIIDNAENKFSQYINLEEGTIRIRCGRSFGTKILYKAMLEFSKVFPKIKIDVSTGELTSEAINNLSKGKCDMVIFKDTGEELPSNVDRIEGYEEELCFYCSKKYYDEHPVKEYSDLEKCDLILPSKVSNTGKALFEFAKNNNFNLPIKFEISSSDAREFFAINDMGIAVGLKSLIKDDIDSGKLIQLKFEKDLPKLKASIAILKGNIASFATLKLLDFIMDVIEEY